MRELAGFVIFVMIMIFVGSFGYTVYDAWEWNMSHKIATFSLAGMACFFIGMILADS